MNEINKIRELLPILNWCVENCSSPSCCWSRDLGGLGCCGKKKNLKFFGVLGDGYRGDKKEVKTKMTISPYKPIHLGKLKI